MKLWSEVKDEVKASTDNNHEDMERGVSMCAALFDTYTCT